LILRDPLFTVYAAVLDHGIPCLAFTIEEEFHINIDKDRLLKRGFPVGPWLTDFKRILRKKPGCRDKLSIEGKSYSINQLKDIAIITRGQKISYVTDIAMIKKNITKVINLVKGSDVLYCEAYFLHQDRERAVERSHLTAKISGLIAKKAGVKKLVPIHFSPKYSDCPELIIREALSEFKR
jgi:ribonuclease Z